MFEPAKYQGKWYEIAKLPFKWEAGCYNTEASYRWDNEKINITNSCIVNNKYYARSGVAKMEPMDESGFIKFKVLFNDGLPNDGLGDYWILYTDYYNYSIVGSSNMDHLWLLSRHRQIEAKDYNLLLKIVNLYGYDTSKLIINKLM